MYLYACMYIYIYIYAYVCVCVCVCMQYENTQHLHILANMLYTHICIYIQICRYMYVLCRLAHMSQCILEYIFKVCTKLSTHAEKYAGKVCMCTYVCRKVRMYRHMYLYIQSPFQQTPSEHQQEPKGKT